MRLTRLLTAAVAASFIAAPAFADYFSVDEGKTKPLRLSGSAGSVVVGNPDVADVAVHTDQLLFISGKLPGSTNLLIFDKQGRMIYSADLLVAASNDNTVTITRAGVDQTYDCTPNCKGREAQN